MPPGTICETICLKSHAIYSPVEEHGHEHRGAKTPGQQLETARYTYLGTCYGHWPTENTTYRSSFHTTTVTLRLPPAIRLFSYIYLVPPSHLMIVAAAIMMRKNNAHMSSRTLIANTCDVSESSQQFSGENSSWTMNLWTYNHRQQEIGSQRTNNIPCL